MKIKAVHKPNLRPGERSREVVQLSLSNLTTSHTLYIKLGHFQQHVIQFEMNDV